MADNYRCWCGKMPHTIDNYCWDHRDQTKVRAEERTPQQRLVSLKGELDWAWREIESLRRENSRLRSEFRNLQLEQLDGGRR